MLAAPHNVIEELLPPTPDEHFVLWVGLGTIAIAATVAPVTLASVLRPTPQSASIRGASSAGIETGCSEDRRGKAPLQLLLTGGYGPGLDWETGTRGIRRP